MTGTRTLIIGLSIGCVALSGCAKSGSDRTHRQSRDQLQQTASERMSALQSSVHDLQRTLSQMPTDDPQQDRSLTLQALGQTSSALAAIEGPNPTGAYRQQLRIIETSRTQIQRTAANTPIEPATDSALRAINNALTSLRDGRFSGNRNVADAVNEVGTKIPQLDAVRGPLHTLAVIDVLSSVSRSLQLMTDIVENRFSPPSSTTRPAAALRSVPVALPAMWLPDEREDALTWLELQE